MPMTLAQIDAKLKEVETHNATLTTRKQVWAEGIKKEFGVETSAELRAMLADVERQLAEKNKEYDAAVAEAERLLEAAMNPAASKGDFPKPVFDAMLAEGRKATGAQC